MTHETTPRVGGSGTLIVTGASRGIGASIARLAGERGYAVAVNFATGEAEARAIVAEINSAGGVAYPIQAGKKMLSGFSRPPRVNLGR